MKRLRLSDYLLLHGDMHKTYSRNYYLIILGILLVGINDVFFESHHFFNDVTQNKGNIIITILYYLILAVIIGFIDVLAVAVPLTDFSNYIKKKTEKKYTGIDSSLIMSSYILAHLILIIPANIVFFIIGKNELLLSKIPHDAFLQNFLSLLYIFVNIIVIAMLVRGLNIFNKMNVAIKIIVFMAAYFWLDLTGIAIGKVIEWMDSFYLVIQSLL